MSGHTQAQSADERAALPDWRQSFERLRYLATYMKPYMRQFIASLLSNVALTVFVLLITYFFKQAITHGFEEKTEIVDMGAVYLFVGIALIITLAHWVASVINQVTGMFAIRVVNDLRVALFRHVQRQGLDFFHNERTGRVISRLTNDIDAIENMVSDGVYMVFSNLLSLIGVEIFLFYLDVKLALAINVVFPPMLIATVVFRYYSTRAYRVTRERMAHVTAHLQETLSGMRVVQAFAAEKRVAAEFDRTNEHYRQANMLTIYQSGLYFPIVELLSAIGTGIVLWYGGLLRADNLVTFGTMFAFIVAMDMFFSPIQQLSQFFNSFLSAMAALDKIMHVMETPPTIVDKPDALRVDKLRGDVRFDDVSFSYGPGSPEVLHHVNFEVAAGQTVALVGHTGAGKSTIVKLLERFYDPSSGRVLVDGIDVRDFESSWFRHSLGIVPQEGFLFSGTIAHNIRFSRPDASDDDVRAAAEAVGADSFIDQLEDGYETHVGERGSHLSAGQRQLVAFARAMLADPALLVLDEATSSVDVTTEMRLAAALEQLVAGRTAFIVAHRLSTIRRADLILVIDDGRIVEQGTHDELLAAEGRYAALYGAWTAPLDSVDHVLATHRGHHPA